MIILLTKTRRKYRDEDIKIPSFTFAKNLTILVPSPCFESVFFSISSPVFQIKVKSGFSQRRLDFFRVRIRVLFSRDFLRVRVRVSKYAISKVNQMPTEVLVPKDETKKQRNTQVH